MQKVRRIEMMARKRATASFAGQFRSSFRGQGLDFDDFREYTIGDEPRFIDWKVTARTGTPYVRKFYEEREQIILLAIDTSASMSYASSASPHSKLDQAASIAAVLAYSAAQNGDKVGLLLYGRKPHFYLPPAQGVKQCLRIVREIISSPPEGEDESIEQVANEILRTQRKRAMVFLISDFYAEVDKKALGRLDFRHEIIPIRIADPYELSLPAEGLINFRDPEQGTQWTADLSDPRIHQRYQQRLLEHRDSWEKCFHQLSIDFIDLQTQQDYIHPLARLFARRSRHFAR